MINKDNVSKILMGTGSYENVRTGFSVSITGDGGRAWGYYGPMYKKLAPRLFTYNSYAKKLEKLKKLKEDISRLREYMEYRKKIEDEYIQSYYDTRLKNLDVMELLYKLSGKYGNDIILLCHEPVDEFCHRRLIADYIELKTGVYIPEVSVDVKGNVKELLPIRYTDRLEKVMK